MGAIGDEAERAKVQRHLAPGNGQRARPHHQHKRATYIPQVEQARRAKIGLRRQKHTQVTAIERQHRDEPDAVARQQRRQDRGMGARADRMRVLPRSHRT